MKSMYPYVYPKKKSNTSTHALAAFVLATTDSGTTWNDVSRRRTAEQKSNESPYLRGFFLLQQVINLKFSPQRRKERKGRKENQKLAGSA